MQSGSRMDKLLPIRTDKRYLGLIFTLLAWVLISATSPTLNLILPHFHSTTPASINF